MPLHCRQCKLSRELTCTEDLCPIHRKEEYRGEERPSMREPDYVQETGESMKPKEVMNPDARTDDEPTNAGETLTHGLQQMVDERTPDHPVHHCSTCQEVKGFEVIETVEREEWGVEVDVLACPDCPYTWIAQTQYRQIGE